MRRSAGVAIAAAVVATCPVGCATDPPDYQSIWSTSTTPTTTTTETPVPIALYLESVGVTGDPVQPEKLTDLKVSFPTPPGWQPYFNTNLMPATRAIAKGDTYPVAMLMVFRLKGDFDVAKAIEHGDDDAELSQNFKRLNSSTEPFKGFPSSMVEGTYDLNGARMQTYNRIVIATGAPPANNRYLIQFTVTGYADKAAEEAPDIEAIIHGFDVSVPK